MTAVGVSALEAGYGAVPVLFDLNLQVPSGLFLAVLGTSGSGKTTLLRALAGFIRPTSGSITFGDTVVAGPSTWVPPERRRVGIVPQEGALFPHLDVFGNVAFGLRGQPRIEERVAEVLELVGLGGRAKSRPQELSGGQMQRVALARALAPRPDVVLLDEPFSALDAGLRQRVRHEVRSLLSSLGTTSILVTHDQEEALSIADRVAIVRHGQIVQDDTPSRLYEAPADLETARFIGAVVELPATRVDDSTVRSALGLTEVDPGGAPVRDGVLTLRPEQLVIVDEQPVGSATRAEGATGQVHAASYHGHDTVITVMLDTGEHVDVRIPGLVPSIAGDRVRVLTTGRGRLYPTPHPHAL
jgi:iron(III) transport system ATP-binding protein